MDGGRRLAAVIAGVIAAALSTVAPARAAQFTFVPPTYVQPTGGPFEFDFAPDDPSAQIAYHVSIDGSFWWRCDTDRTLSLSGLDEGEYTVAVADDPTPCNTLSSAAPATPQTERVLIVDGTPPSLTNVVVQRPGADPADVQVQATAGDDGGSGVESVTWLAGDGSPAVQGPTLTHRYRPGTWTGTVTATDRAGNSTSARFPVSVPRPPLARHITPPRPVPPPVTPPADKLAPTILELKIGTRLLTRTGLLVRATIIDRGVFSATGTVRIAGRSYRLQRSGVRTNLPQPFDLHLTASTPVRRAVRRALAHHIAVRAQLRILARDMVGNARVLHRTIRLRG